MKKTLVIASLLAASTGSFALNCGNLGIKISNTSNQECVIRNKSLFYGFLDKGVVPSSIPSGTTSDTFYMLQDSVGVGIQLAYQCGDKMVKFYSYQEYCLMSAGEVGGVADIWNDLAMNHRETWGSFWFGTPGQITWQIHE